MLGYYAQYSPYYIITLLWRDQAHPAITETLEIGFWMILLVLNTLFYPATSITL